MRLENKVIKTGTAVFLCVLVSNFLKLKFPFFVALPAVMPMSNSIEQTLKAGRNRMFGTIIGALMGVLLAVIHPYNSILSAVGIIIIIYICDFIRWGSATSIAGLVFISIILGLKGENPWLYSLNRIADTFIGILITILVNNLIFHKNIVKVLEKRCKDIQTHLLDSAKKKICLDKHINLRNLNGEIEHLRSQLAIYTEEINLKKDKKSKIRVFEDTVSRFDSIYENLKIISSIDKVCTINESNMKRIKELYGENFIKEPYIQSDINTVFNYHTEKILEQLSYLNTIFHSSP